MRAIVAALILAKFCTGCTFEAQRALGCNDVDIFGCKDKAQPRTPDDVPPLRRAEGRTDVLTNNRGERYYPGTPSYVPLIDNCIIAGGTRAECIEALPPEELKKLEAAEAERGAILREQMRARRAMSSKAESLTFGSVRVEVVNGWLHTIERPRDADWGDLIAIRHPDGVGTLRMQSYVAPGSVSREVLRNMTNVESTIQLNLQNWGDYSGYQHDYLEKGSFFRQWWLTNDRTIVFVTYRCRADLRELETHQINDIVSSLRVNTP